MEDVVITNANHSFKQNEDKSNAQCNTESSHNICEIKETKIIDNTISSDVNNLTKDNRESFENADKNETKGKKESRRSTRRRSQPGRYITIVDHFQVRFS